MKQSGKPLNINVNNKLYRAPHERAALLHGGLRMAYYLGKDVGLVVSTEDPSYGVTVTAANALSSASPGATIGPRALAGYSTPNFNESIGVISNLTGVDLGIGSTDEDVSFMGANTPLKAEVHKETTLTITKKKNSPVFDLLFSWRLQMKPMDADGVLKLAERQCYRWS